MINRHAEHGTQRSKKLQGQSYDQGKAASFSHSVSKRGAATLRSGIEVDICTNMSDAVGTLQATSAHSFVSSSHFQQTFAMATRSWVAAGYTQGGAAPDDLGIRDQVRMQCKRRRLPSADEPVPVHLRHHAVLGRGE
jgi:AraC-like DNA-binding protein